MTFLLLEFGYEQMSTLVAHYSTTLEKAGVNGEAALREWSTVWQVRRNCTSVDDNQVCLIICTEKVFYIILLLYKLQIWDKDP